MINKNQIIELEITDMSHEGSGIGRHEGMAIFVPDSAVGDKLSVKIVKVNKNYAFGKLEEILTPSDDRIDIDCVVSKRCGGCTFRHIAYPAELLYKQNFVASNIKKIGGFELALEPISGSPKELGYRNKAQYPIRTQNGQINIGFFAKRTHDVIPCLNCRLQPAFFTDILKAIQQYIAENHVAIYDEKLHTGAIRHIYIRSAEATGEVMVCIVSNESILPASDELVRLLKSACENISSIVINVNKEKTNVILGKKNKTLYGKGYITDILCGVRINISPLSFYQVNHDGAELLYGIAADYAALTGNETLIDLYCGAGTIGLSMANRVKQVIGIEVVEAAIQNAEQNAEQNGITNARFICADASSAAKQLIDEGIAPDVVVLDPPRKGCDLSVIHSVCKMNPARIVMISCDSATLARDCGEFIKRGYQVVKGRAVDMFPRTTHVETVCLLSKLKSDHHIEVNLNMDELDLTSAESKATYEEIKEYVLKNSGFKVSSLYIGQVKEKMGIKERENYNISKKEDAKVPKCPADKEKAIVDALKHFNMID